MPALALVTMLLLPLPWRNGTVHDVQQKVGGWTLDVRNNSFTADARCHLVKGRVSFTRGVLIFRLSPGVDTSEAYYRVDGGEPRAAKAELMSVAHAGLAIYDDQLANPSGGVVRIPAERVGHGKLVAIQANTTSAPRRFDIAGLDSALDQAAKLGCTPTTFE
jgi:hypothetical protein